MDPLSMLSLATTIITCIDLTGKLIIWSVEMCQNSRVKENDFFSTVIHDLDLIVKDLRKDPPGNTDSERRIFSIAEKCQQDTIALLEMLKSMELRSGKKDVIKCVRIKLASLKEKKKMEDLKGRFQEYRVELMLNL